MHHRAAASKKRGRLVGRLVAGVFEVAGVVEGVVDIV